VESLRSIRYVESLRSIRYVESLRSIRYGVSIDTLAPARTPCSASEREAAQTLANDLGRLGLQPVIETVRAPTSPSWVPLLRALARVWAAAFLAAGFVVPAQVLAGLAVVGGVPILAASIRFLPLLGGATQNVVVRIRGSAPDARPIIVTAHMDTHPTNGAPLHRWHRLAAALSGILALGASFAGVGARGLAGVIAAEGVVTLAWLARRELARSHVPPDDNTSGLMALTSVADLAAQSQPAADIWLVASGAGTAGGCGITAFLRTHRDLRRGWVIEIDALGSGEVVGSPVPPRLPHPGTPSVLVRALVAAAQSSGDPLSVRRVRRPHSDARAALRYRTPAITLTAGILHPAREPGPDPANAARAARVVLELARRVDSP